jgi:hypothetical protein
MGRYHHLQQAFRAVKEITFFLFFGFSLNILAKAMS